jgi:hypothetical protein
MITEPTLFILGAGASKPYGFPIGAELRAEIINNFYNDLDRMLPSGTPAREFEKQREMRDAKDFIEHFSNSPETSIDKFLSLNPRLSRHGKMAITISICKHESQSQFLERMGGQHFTEDWYRLLFTRMTSRLKVPGDFARFPENKVAFVTFNYDRSLEYFLYKSYYHNFSESRRAFEHNMRDYISFPIIHVYGQIAELPISFEAREDHYRAWGDIQAGPIGTIESMSSNIRVVGERAQEGFKEKASQLLDTYKRIFFLGFGYAEENLDAIGFPGNIDETWTINGTARGMTLKEILDVRRSLARNFKSNIYQAYPGINPRIEDRNSYELLREHL